MANRPTLAQAAEAAAAEQLGAMLLKLETCPAQAFRLTPLSVTGPLASGPVVLARVDDQAFRLSPAEARLAARCMTWEAASPASRLLAVLFETAAQDAEDMAGLRGLTAAGGRLVEGAAA